MTARKPDAKPRRDYSGVEGFDKLTRREQSRINGAKNAKSKGQPRPKKGEGK